jgi:hypothetical protein
VEGRGGKSARWSTIRAEQENLVKLDGRQGTRGTSFFGISRTLDWAASPCCNAAVRCSKLPKSRVTEGGL